MNRNHITRVALFASALLAPAASSAEDSGTNYLNQVTVSARFGFNMSARFKGLAALPLPMSSRLTARGDRYNYDDGYVLTDNSGNFGGQTWYWGYDNSASQIAGNTVLLSRSTVMGGSAGQALDSEPSVGAEVVFRRQLSGREWFRFGVEAAANYQNMTASGSSSGSASVSRTTDAYPFSAGTTPPTATSGSVYQGSYEGPGFVIGDSPASSSSTIVPGGATVIGNEHLNADIWGLRVGPYVDFPLGDHWDLSLSAGLAVGLLNPSVSWSETVLVTGGGSGSASGIGSDFTALCGGYVAGTLTWQMSERWSVAGGVQYQVLQDYNHSFGGQQVEINLERSLFLTIGVGYSF